MASHWYQIVVLCSLWIASNGKLTMDLLKDRHVVITGPQNVTVFLRTADRIVVAWTMPEIYIPHDPSVQKFEKLETGDHIGVLKPMFSFEPHEVEKMKNGDIPNANTTSSTADKSEATPTKAAVTPTKGVKDANTTTGESAAPTTAPKNDKAPTTPTPSESASQDKNTDKNAASGTQPSATDKSPVAGEQVTPAPTSSNVKRAAPEPPVNLNRVICQQLVKFADYTVEDRTNEQLSIKDNGWALSLLESDLVIPATNMSLFYSDMQHKLVKFEEGCVTKVVVTYSNRATGQEIMITLNASDHLVSIENLASGVDYKIVVTAHFMSGDSISSKAIYATTLYTGSSCLCDWHGTIDHKSDCENPSATEQHCKCSASYTGRFCADCADGFYRDKLGDACKECPCGEHGGFKSSCRFVQGFLTCDTCGKGYKGSVCHKCADGYFRYKDVCRECLCNNNTVPHAPNMCDPLTGMCEGCLYNTTGFYCERCLQGYVRVPNVHSGSCYALSDAGKGYVVIENKKSSSKSSSGISSGVVGAIIFVVLLCVLVVVGLCIVRRVRANRQRRALWTVEMRPDNDDLDFNSVHNEDARMDQIDDMAFYDRQAGRSKAGGKYSKLNEEC